MKIVIGDYSDPTDSRNLILNDEVRDKASNILSRCFGYISKVEGLETAPYRNGTGDWSGTDGGYMSSQLYGAREITISGFYNDRMAWCSPTTFQSGDNFDHYARLYLRSRLPIRTLQIVRIYMDSKMVFYTEAYCIDLKMDYDKVNEGEFQITLYCPDPALYIGAGDGEIGAEWLSSSLYKEKDVGYVNPYELPLKWSTGGRSAPVEYEGDFSYAPQIIARGPLVNPAFTLLETGQTLRLGYSTDTACTVRITDTEAAGQVATIGETLVTGFYGSTAPLETPMGGCGSGLKLSYTAAQQSIEAYAISGTGALSIQNRGTGYAVGDLVKVVFDSVSAGYEPAYYRIDSVDSGGGILSWMCFSLGSYGQELSQATANLVAVSGAGSGAVVTASTERRTYNTAGYFSYSVNSIIDGGSGYQVGDVIYVVPPDTTGQSYVRPITLTTFTVGSTSGTGAITALEIVNAGEYEMDLSTQRVTLISPTGSPGTGALVDVEMTQNENTKIWSVSSVSVAEGGKNYLEDTEFVPQVWASTTFQISASQTLTIDMAEHTVTVDGASRSHYIHPDSQWFSLLPNQTNHILFTSQGLNDAQTATVRWRNAYQGI